MRHLLDYASPPRASFARFPSAVQPLVTFLSGKPLPQERPWLRIHPVAAISIDLTKLVAGLAFGAFCAHRGGAWWIALPLCWILVVNAVRSLTSDAHYAGHACVSGRSAVDWWIGEVLSTLVLSANMEQYAPGHNALHHGRTGIGSLDDPDIELLHLMGFKAARPRAWYWRRLWLGLVSPRYHFLYARARLLSNFVQAQRWRLVLSYALHLSALALVAWSGAWSEWALAWLVPVGPLVAISAALQFPSEHLWLAQQEAGESPRAFVRRISHGRFFLVPAPRPDLSYGAGALAWATWTVLMLPMLFARFFVCVSILPAHDYHHRKARIFDWPMECYLRQQDIDRGAVGYREFYGLADAFNAQFDVWSKLPSVTVPERFTILGLLERERGLHAAA